MFDKNLESLNNEALKRRLRSLDMNNTKEGISYIMTTESNDYIILKNDIPIDDLKNPRKAIAKHFEENIKSEMRPNDIIVIFGIGLGYILDEAFNRYPSKIFLYEPDLNLLHFVLNNVDISEHLSSGRVFISNDIDELINKISEVYITKDKVEVVYLPNYAVIRNQDLLVLTQKVYDSCKSKLVDINTIAKFSKRWLINTLENIASANNKTAYKLSDLENKFIGQTALIAGAGPSLNDNIEKIKANRHKFVIFAVNKSVKYLVENGVIPDFAVCLDAGNMEKTLDVADEFISKMNCIADIRTDKTVFQKPFKKIFLNFAETDFVMKKLAKFNTGLKFYEGGGTASTLALVSAIKLGFAQIVTAGIDLAFKDNVIYTDGQVMDRISQEEILVDNVKKNLVRVKSVTGGEVYTRDDYQAFIHHFASILKEQNYSEVYNLSTFGAYIEGVKTASFEDLNLFSHANTVSVDVAEPFKFELAEFMQDEFFIINNVISLLSKDVFSSALVSSILKSVLLYQYLQTEILDILQKQLNPQYAEGFIDDTKAAIKTLVEILQKNRLI